MELRVARSLVGGHAVSAYPSDPLGRRSQSRAYPGGTAGVGVPSTGHGPSVTLSDPLGGTTHMLNPHHPGSTRIQVRLKRPFLRVKPCLLPPFLDTLGYKFKIRAKLPPLNF